MNETGFLLASGLLSMGVQGGLMCNSRRKKNKLYKSKLSALIIPRGCGKSTLKRSLQSLKSDLEILDLNKQVKNNDDRLKFLEDAKVYVANLLKLFKNKRFLILCSNKEEAEYIGVCSQFMFICVPSSSLLKQIKGDCEEIDKREQIERKYLELIRETDQNKLNIFSTFDELYTVIKQEYKLQSNF